MKFLLENLKNNKQYRDLSSAVKNFEVPAIVTGLSSIHKSAIVSALAKEHSKKVLYLCSDEAECYKLMTDLNELSLKSVFYPVRDFTLRDTVGSSHEFERQRLEVLDRLINGAIDCVVATIESAMQFTIPQNELKSRTVEIKAGDEIIQKKLIETLVYCGYENSSQVEGVGQFSHRGGIIDFFPPGSDKPIRLEFWGDEIDTISSFDIETQRRGESLDSVRISPCVEVIPNNTKQLVLKMRELQNSIKGKSAVVAKPIIEKEIKKLEDGLHLACLDKYISLVYENPVTLFDYFNRDNSFIVLSEGSKIREKAKTVNWQWSEDIKAMLTEGVLCKGLDKYSQDWVYVLKKAEELPSLHLDNFARGTYEIPTKTLINMNVKQLSLWGGSTELLKDDINAHLSIKQRIVVLAGTERSAKVLAEDLKAQGIPCGFIETFSVVQKGTVVITTGGLSAGFEIDDLVVISQGRINSSTQEKKKKKKDKNTKEIYSLAELSMGDYVVHNTHGIGLFLGIHKMEVGGILKDYIKIEYAKSDTLYVPVTQLDMVGKYIGPREDSSIKLHRLGGTEWQKAKTKVKSAVKDIAKELIKLYAERMNKKGFAFPEDNEWQRDFEAHFEYNETDDQLRCIEEIKSDMESIVPMDRLLCGDVGFGKTEVAFRAAFKCITAGKQCAILVPTTILAWQHFQNVIKRMDAFPVSIELLSRFRTAGQQSEILRKIKDGSVDIVVGTHRLISKDVKFKDLGLAIVDEEQRFGVAQKERLKQACKDVDFLTLSATPIPRTLSMAMSGIRDMSLIEEAPHDRHPVHTYVLEHDLGIIADALRKELRRGGQAYYIHNDIATLKGVAAKIQSLIPEIRIAVAHGKMAEDELSETWRQLMEQEIDLLICTTIIETGVDVANVNTLIIDNADRMGLSQLHQIRGRVGRSNRRAYAYFTYTPNKTLTEISQKRLSAIREFTEFGSGFKIAMRDLEIRGAGNILGGEQHGHMESVGYDMYLKLLNQAVSLMKGEEPQQESCDCSIDLPINAHIPERYIDSIQTRLEVYKKIADIKSYDDSIDVTDELIDRFGEPPAAVQGLIDIALLRNIASSMFIKEVKQQNTSLLLYLEKIDMEKVSKLTEKMKGRVLLSAGASPYISINTLKQKPLDVLEDALKIMQ